MRLLLAVMLATGCSRILGIGDEFRAPADGDSDGLGDLGIDAAVLEQQYYVKASNPGTGDQFGWVVAVSRDGTTMAVGAPYEDSNARGINQTQANEMAIDSGAVYVFVRTASSWMQQAYIKSSNSDAGDRFGFAVALSDNGSLLLVGAPLEDSAGVGPGGINDNMATNAGAVYAFERTGTTWVQDMYLKPSNTQAGDQFGNTIALSGSGGVAAISAHLEDSAADGIGGAQTDNTAADAGAVYILRRDAPATWTQEAYIKASNSAAGAYFGRALDLSQSANTLVAGAIYEATTAAGSGAAYVFTRNGFSWSQQAYLKAGNAGLDDNFGWCTALSADGNVLVVGAPNEDGGSTGINGNRADDPAKMTSGAAYVFTRTGTAWTEEAYVKATNTDQDDQFGIRCTVSYDARWFGVTAQHEDGGGGLDGDQFDNSRGSSGAAYQYSRGTGGAGTYALAHYLKASNAETGDRFGHVGPGTIGLVQFIGAPEEDGASAGINGDLANNSAPEAGAVYVFGE